MDYLIETNFEGPNYVMVPNAVARMGADEGMSADALGVLVYMASLPRGSIVRVSQVRECFKIGRDHWQRIARDLTRAGALEVKPLREVGTGRVYGSHVSIRWPEVAAPKTGKPGSRSSKSPTTGKPVSRYGKPGSGQPENPVPSKEEDCAGRDAVHGVAERPAKDSSLLPFNEKAAVARSEGQRWRNKDGEWMPPERSLIAGE
jgi:hypothetical protein